MKSKEWFAKWLEVYVKSCVRKNTYQKYLKITLRHIVPYLGDRELETIKADEIREFLFVELYGKQNLSSSSVNIVLSILKSAFNAAEDIDLIYKNPCAKIRRMPTNERKIDAFTKAEQRKIENYVLGGDNLKLYGVVIGLYTGLRVGELLALRWNDVDFHRNLLRVNKTISQGGDLSPTKTKAGIREIPISKILLPLLKEMQKKAKSEFVIETNGHYTDLRGYQGLFTRLLKKLNVRELGFHSLRHTFATRAIESGVDIKTLSTLMGHANAMITINRYAHSMMDTKRKAINKLSKMREGNY